MVHVKYVQEDRMIWTVEQRGNVGPLQKTKKKSKEGKHSARRPYVWLKKAEYIETGKRERGLKGDTAKTVPVRSIRVTHGKTRN